MYNRCNPPIPNCTDTSSKIQAATHLILKMTQSWIRQTPSKNAFINPESLQVAPTY